MDILEKNKGLKEVHFKNLGMQKMYLNENLLQDLVIKKLFIKNVIAFDYKKFITNQASNLVELEITNMGISMDHLYEYDICVFPNLRILEINIYGVEFGDAEMRFLNNITDLHIIMESLESLFAKLDLLIKLSPRLERVKLKATDHDSNFRNACGEWLNCEVKMKIANDLTTNYGINPRHMIRRLKYRNYFNFEL